MDKRRCPEVLMQCNRIQNKFLLEEREGKDWFFNFVKRYSLSLRLLVHVRINSRESCRDYLAKVVPTLRAKQEKIMTSRN